jgi:outer membrane autotransporter protein
VSSGPVALTPYLGAYWVDEASQHNRESFSTGGAANTINLQDLPTRSYARIDLGATAKRFYGAEGFAKVGVDAGSGVNGWTGNVGVRWRW